ncbi:hypothetical protein WJX72_001344 [[Myrmecia] bisecta]|uniref:Uncharacterized protein n=1 Tax=[Myrmecia] bisecta TaxID=41462 RepID=A0AAW1P492_9CHLO
MAEESCARLRRLPWRYIVALLLVQAVTCSRLGPGSISATDPARTFRKLLQRSASTGSRTGGEKKMDGVWQGITYSPAAIVVDDEYNLLAAACVNSGLYAKFTGLSGYLDGRTILMNQTFTVDGTSVDVNVTDGQAITIALSQGVGNVTLYPFAVSTVQPNYTLAGTKEDLVLLRTDPQGDVDWCLHWSFSKDARGKQVLATAIEEVRIELQPSGRPLLHAVCELGTNPPTTLSSCTSEPLPAVGAAQLISSSAADGSPQSLGLGIIYDPVAYCSSNKVPPQLEQDCAALSELAAASSVGTKNATKFCFPASGAAVSAAADQDLCCAVGTILQLQAVDVDSDLVDLYCGVDSGLADLDPSLLPASSPEPGLSGDLLPSSPASPAVQQLLPSAPPASPSPTAGKGPGGTPLNQLVNAQHNLALTNIKFGPTGLVGRRLLATAPTLAPSPARATTSSTAATARRLFGDNLGLQLPTSVITRTEFVCISGPCLDLLV